MALKQEAKVPVDIPYMRSVLILNKHFLKALYDAKKSTQISAAIDIASNEEIFLLLKIFHLEANNVILLFGAHVKTLTKKKKLNLLKKHFGDESNFESLMLEDISVLRNLLKKFIPVIKILLGPLFENQ